MVEIERKFIVAGDEWKDLPCERSHHITQGYLHRSPDVSTRVRVTGQNAFLTIKSTLCGISRNEFEYAIPYSDGLKLLSLADATLEKTRYCVRDQRNQLWEIDVFAGLNDGLVIAELEMHSTRQRVSLPSWIGKDVSEDPRFYNMCLVDHCVVGLINGRTDNGQV